MTTPQPFTPPYPLNTAVLFLVFNRLDTTKQVFEAIRQAKPPRLYIAADGARETKDGEAEKVQAVREYVMENIDWDCKVKTLFREKNLGCKYAVSGAITWFFENEEQGIILEDDCLPSQSFFWYCEELLEKYKEDETVYLISGDARGPESFGMKEDYGFCKYPMIWGWASWARVWKNYDPEILDWPQSKDQLIRNISNKNRTRKYWEMVFSDTYNKKIDTWDYQFSFQLLRNSAKCIVPSKNMIKNIGFGVEATHTKQVCKSTSFREIQELKFPLDHRFNKLSENKVNDFYDKQFSLRPLALRYFINVYRKYFKSLMS